jgi:hypothetical protein
VNWLFCFIHVLCFIESNYKGVIIRDLNFEMCVRCLKEGMFNMNQKKKKEKSGNRTIPKWFPSDFDSFWKRYATVDSISINNCEIRFCHFYRSASAPHVLVLPDANQSFLELTPLIQSLFFEANLNVWSYDHRCQGKL